MNGVAVRLAVLVVVAAALGATLAACDGDDSGAEVSGSPAASSDGGGASEEIETLTDRFHQILAEKDVAAFCRILAPNDVLRLGGGKTNGRRECLTVWGRDRNPLFTAEVPELSVESIDFEGSYATARLTNGGKLAFAREGGRWYVHLAPGAGQGG
jgi:hypothetical protein